MSTTLDDEDPFDSLLKHIHKHGKSFWFKLYDNERDFATDIEVDIGSVSSLQRYCNLKREQYIALLIRCGLLAPRGNGHRLHSRKFEHLLGRLSIDGEVRPYDPRGGPGQRWYVRLGQTFNGYHTSVTDQVQAASFIPSRIGSLLSLKYDLRCALEGSKDDDSNNISGSESESEDESDNDNDNTDSHMKKVDSTCVDKLSTIDITITDQTEESFSPSTLSKAQLEYSIGVLVSEQQKRKRCEEEESTTPAAVVSPNNDRTTSNTRPSKKSRPNPPFEFAKGDVTYTAIPMLQHKDDIAFDRYQYKMPYVQCIIEELGKTKGKEGINESQGATRLLKRLAKNYPSEYTSVAKRRKLTVNGVINDVGLAATDRIVASLILESALYLF